MKLLILFTLLLCQSLVCHAAELLSAERLTEIVDLPHEDKLTEPALSIYPKARAYDIALTNTMADGQVGRGNVTATEKWVAGRYIVSEAQPAGPDTRFAMIVEYDSDTQRYRKYIWKAGTLSGYQEGTLIANTRTVAWIDLTESKFDSDIDCLSTETHTDIGTTWHSLFYQGGKFQRSEVGIAKVTK